MVDAVFNGLLAGSAGFALASLSPSECPILSVACAIGLCHGLCGLYGNVVDGTSNSKAAEGSSGTGAGDALQITQHLMDLAVLPLVNIDFYLASTESTNLALGHGLFVIPLALDISKLYEQGDEENTEALRELSILGNILSLLFLAVNESRLPVGLMALSAFIAAYGPLLSEQIVEGWGQNVTLLAYAAFYALIPMALETCEDFGA